jgi:MFS family permease
VVAFRGPVVVPNLAVLLQSMIGVGWLYLLTVYFQDVRGLDARGASALFVPMTVISVVSATLAGPLTPRLGPRRSATVGLGLVGCGLATMVAGVGSSSAATVVLGSVIGEAGFMLANVALTHAATAPIDDDRSGLAAGLVNSSTELGGALGVGLIAAAVATTAATPTASAVSVGFLVCLVSFCLPALVLVHAGLPREEPVRT